MATSDTGGDERDSAKLIHQLRERSKELQLFYELAALGGEESLPLDRLLQRAVELIPPAWHYPEETCGRITIDGTPYVTEGFRETEWKQSTALHVSGEPVGTVEVYYLTDKPERDEGPFLCEERKLLDSMARQLEQIISFRRSIELRAQSERRYRSTFEQAAVGMAHVALDGRWIEVNQRLCEIVGYARQELLALTFQDITHPDDLDTDLRYVERLVAGEIASYAMEKRCLRKDRSVVWINLTATLARDGEGQPDHFIAVIEDISSQVEAREALERTERELRRSEAQTRAVLDATPFPVAVVDAEDDRVLYWSRSALEIFGHTAPTSAEWYEIAYPDPDYRREVVERWKPMLEQARRSGRAVNAGEYRITCKDGSVRVCELYAAFVGGNLIVTLNDVTARRAMEARLAQADRLSSMGLLAAGVAHEINNPLAYVLYNLESCGDDLRATARAVRSARARLDGSLGPARAEGLLGEAATRVNPVMLDDIAGRFADALEGAGRIRDITRGLGAFSRVEPDRPAPVNLVDVIEVAANMANNEIKYRAQVARDYGTVPTVLASEGRLAQVFLNLLINASHAIDEGDSEHNEIRLRTWAAGADVFAEVRDTGRGIAPEDLGRLFEPFFSTKETGAGSGLGLAISRDIVEGYGGEIAVESELGKGASFTVRLPVTAAEQQTDEAPAEPEGPVEGTGRVLIVDDEQRVRKAVAHILRAHETVQASGAGEAQRILAEDQAFDVILCDMMMPEVSGMDLHRWLRQQHPPLAERLVFVTGGAFTPDARAYLREIGNLRLEKPLDVLNLREVVADRVRRVRRA